MDYGLLILITGALLAVAIAATLAAGRLRVPGLVLFLGIGMAIGSDGFDWIHIGFDDVELIRTIGVIALALILFEGGLAAGWDEIRPVLGPSLSLATVGTIATAFLTGAAAMWVLDFDLLEGLLLGSIVAATDSAAIFSILRGSTLRRRLARTLEGESGFNDPVAILLVVGFIDWIQKPDYGVVDMLGLLVAELSIGAAVGGVVGVLAVRAFRGLNFGTSGLYPVASIATAALAFGIAEVAYGSGFLAVYIAGLTLGSARIPARRTIGDFHDGVAWVGQIALFVTLGLLTFPSTLDDVAGEALLIAAALMFVARPAAAVLATLPTGFSLREGVLIGWAGLRGAVPIVLATFPVIENVEGGESFFNIVFFVVLASTIVQAATFEPLARALRLTSDEPALGRPIIEVGTIRRLGAEVLEFPVREGDAAAGRLVNELGLPREALVSVIVRSAEAILPRGSTEIAAGDRLHILVREPVRDRVEGLFERWREGPIVADEPAAPRPRGRAAIFSVRRWHDDDGDPADPRHVSGVPVLRRLRVRRETAGALVQLEDGRYAVTGDGVAAVGSPRQVFRYCGERIRRAGDEQSRAWWQEAAGVLAQRVAR